MKRNDEEHHEQTKLVQWFELQFPEVRVLAIPNGGNRNIITAKKLKAEGVRRGVPDLLIPAWGLWIEMKNTKGGRVSPEQKQWIEYLRGVGHTVFVCAGFLAARRMILEFQEAR
jgi:hypothetical protein